MKERVKILLVDDQPAKLLSYETVLSALDETLIRSGSAQEALDQLLRNDIAVILIDVCMPDLDGFQLAEMIREHPRFKKIGIIFVSAVQMTDIDRLRGYQLGAVDYVPVPVIPELLRAKVRVFTELFRKTQELERLNEDLERRVAERTAELAITNTRLTMAIDVAQLDLWEWDFTTNRIRSSPDDLRPADPGRLAQDQTLDEVLARVHPSDRAATAAGLQLSRATGTPYHHIYRAVRTNGAVAWCSARARVECDAQAHPVRMVGVVMDISEHKLAEERQAMMMQELHHRVKNTLATVQAIATLNVRKATDLASFIQGFNSRMVSLSRTHTMLVDHQWDRIDLREILQAELNGFDDDGNERIRLDGPPIALPSQTALSVGLAFHELATNAAKYGALSVPAGRLTVSWSIADSGNGKGDPRMLRLQWRERHGPPVTEPTRQGFGSALLERLFGTQGPDGMKLHYHATGLEVDLAMPWAPQEPAFVPGSEREREWLSA